MMVVTTEQATVYRGGGRRWFSLNAACNAEAAKLHRERFRKDCYCCDNSYSERYGHEPGETCHLHAAKFYSRWRRRVARILAARPQHQEDAK